MPVARAPRPAALDPERLEARRLSNALHSALLLVGMAGLLGVLGWIIAGATGLVWSALLGLVLLALSPRVSGRLVLRMYGARELAETEAPGLYALVAELAARAGLEAVPRLHYLPTPSLNAFAVGRRGAAAIAITDGLLRRFESRELAGVLAHEVSHVRADDLGIMTLADTVGRLTRMLSTMGLLLFVLNLPLYLMGAEGVSWLLILLLYFSPTLSGLLQLALSRTRELAADTEAAGLTGDPLGLAQALRKLESYQGRLWEQIFFPGRRPPDASILRTHPTTEERVARLLALATPAGVTPLAFGPAAAHLPSPLGPAPGRSLRDWW